jgi:hypothetical protein
MGTRKRKGTVVTLAFIFFLSVSSAHAYVTCTVPNTNITAIQGFPSPIIAGNTYTVRYRFSNVGNDGVSFFVIMNVSNRKYPVNMKEFFVSMWLNSSKLNCTERKPGSFYCYNKTSENSLKGKSSGELYINFSSLPNLFPDNNYTFSLDILTEHPFINVLFAQGDGSLKISGKTVYGQAKIYTDQNGGFMRFWIKDTRTKSEYARDYEVRSRVRTWYGEVYSCRNELGQTLTMTVYFQTFVYASGTDVSFSGMRAR